MSVNDVISGDGAGFDEDPIPFGEAFGVNPDGSPYEPEESAPEQEEDDSTPEPPAADEGPGDDAAEAPVETPQEVAERLLAGKYKTPDDLEKGYKELERKLSEVTAKPKEEPEQPLPPLFKGEVGEIKTEKDLYDLATADPERAAHFAMENLDRLSESQVNAVMDHWLATQPWKAMTQIHAWQTQMIREEMNERQAVQDAHYINNARDQGIEQAIAAQPMLRQYTAELGEYIEANPHLNEMVENAKTADEVATAIEAIFYMMAGRELAQQALEARVAQQVLTEEQQVIQQQAEQAASRATSITRNTAPPPAEDEDYVKAMQDAILNPGGRRAR